MKECPKTCGVCTVTCMDHDPGCKGWASATGGKLCESEEDKARCPVIPPPIPSYRPLASCASRRSARHASASYPASVP